jgi:hypothetical protein
MKSSRTCGRKSSRDHLADRGVMEHVLGKRMRNARILLLMACALVDVASADVVGVLNVHTAPGLRATGWDSGRPVAVQVDFSRTEDGNYDVTVWSGTRQFDKIFHVQVEGGKVAQDVEGYRTGPVVVYCPATDLKQNGPTSFQVFVQAVFDNGQKGGKVLIAEAAWQINSVADDRPGRAVEPRPITCSAGSGLDRHATGSFVIKNKSANSLPATLFFGGRKYREFNLSGHADQKLQADVWGANPAVGWYVTTPNPHSPNGQQIEAAGPIYDTEGGSDAGFNTLELDGPEASPTPTPSVLSSPTVRP